MSDGVLVKNPVYLPEVTTYIDSQIASNIPTISMASCRLAMKGRGAVMDNSNQAAEGGFRWLKHDPEYQETSQSVATYLHFYWQQSQRMAKKYAYQLRSLEQIVQETNARSERHNARIDAALSVDPNDNGQKIKKHSGTTSAWKFLKILVLSDLVVDEDEGSDKKLLSSGIQKTKEQDEVKERSCTQEPVVEGSTLESVVQEGSRPEEITDEMVTSLQFWRDKWGILDNPEEFFIPKRVKKMIEKFCVRCLENNKEFGNEWAQFDGEHMPKIILTEKESAGVSKYEGHPLIETKDGRKLLGASMKDEPSWHNRYSGAIVSLDKDPIFVEVFKDIPEELFPSKNKTKESMITKLSQYTLLDVLWNHFPHPGCPLTSWQESKQPARQTMSQVVKMPYTYNSDKPPGEEEGNGEDVIRLFVYPKNDVQQTCGQTVRRWDSYSKYGWQHGPGALILHKKSSSEFMSTTVLPQRIG
eukprot:scaffold39177_cov38-Cyclotella_meneghiniana.AAC.3